MGRTATTIFTYNKIDHHEVQHTLDMLPQVLRNMTTKASYKSLGYQDKIQSVAEYNTLQKQEQAYLEGILNLSNCTEIEAVERGERRMMAPKS